VLSVIAVGNVSMSAQELVDNIMACASAFLAALQSRDRLKAIQLHATRGPTFTVYSNQGRRPRHTHQPNEPSSKIPLLQ
jgi:ribosomal protein L1